MIEWLVAVYFASFMVVSVYTLALLVVIIRYRRYEPPTMVEISKEPPDVTVQLPVYNPDKSSFMRCIDAIEKMAYPTDHLQIQVLDDSTNVETTSFVREVCESRSIGLIHRDTREGYRGGSLR